MSSRIRQRDRELSTLTIAFFLSTHLPDPQNNDTDSSDKNVAGPPVSTTHARWLYHKNELPRALIRGEQGVACQFQRARVGGC